MASFRKDEKSGVYRIHFWFGGKQYQKSLKTSDAGEAEATTGAIAESLGAMEKGWIAVPPADKFWPALNRALPRGALLALYRAAFFYGTSRWIAWTIWAHVVHHYPYDLSWGGPHWVHAARP